MRVILAVTILLVAALVITALYASHLLTKLKGLDRPELWLPRRERREYARELLSRERDDYDLQRQQALIEAIQTELRKK